MTRGALAERVVDSGGQGIEKKQKPARVEERRQVACFTGCKAARQVDVKRTHYLVERVSLFFFPLNLDCLPVFRSSKEASDAGIQSRTASLRILSAA